MPAMPMADSRPPIVVGISVTSSAASTGTPSGRAGILRKPDQRHDGDQEDDRQAREQDVERDLVRRLAAFGALDQLDHAVDEGVAGGGGDADDQPVRHHLRAAGDRAAVAAGLADDRGGFAGDGALVDAGDALDDVAVATASNRPLRPAPGRRHADRARATCCSTVRSLAERSRLATVSLRARRRHSARARPRPSATASAKVANRTVSHSQSGDGNGEVPGLPGGDIADAERR